MRIVVVGTSSAVAERGWTVVALEADLAAARERVVAGEADGVASLDDSGWLQLSLPPDGTQGTRVKSALAERDRRGQRIGRPARRPPRALVQRCFDAYDEQGSYERAARALEAAGETTPTGAAWYPVTVKRILEASAAETRRILRRVGHILAEVDASGTVTEAELRALGDEHEFHPERLRATPPGPYTPPLVRTEGRYALSDAGRALLGVWRSSERLDDRVEQLLLDVSGGVGPARYEQLCRRRGVAAADVPEALLHFAQGRFALTAAGERVATTWRRITSLNPAERLDADFWPSPEPERRDWDWGDSPPTLKVG